MRTNSRIGKLVKVATELLTPKISRTSPAWPPKYMYAPIRLRSKRPKATGIPEASTTNRLPKISRSTNHHSNDVYLKAPGLISNLSLAFVLLASFPGSHRFFLETG
jgi:hypothetical protein